MNTEPTLISAVRTTLVGSNKPTLARSSDSPVRGLKPKCGILGIGCPILLSIYRCDLSVPSV